jgi:membrane protein DedA with SNARE-associated domain
MHIISDILSFIKSIIEHSGYWGMGLAIMLESACIPIPSEIILPVAGMLASAKGSISFPIAFIVLAFGSMTGSYIAYAVGYYGGRPFVQRFGKYFFVKERHLDKSEVVFKKYGSPTVFFGRFLPIIRTFISLPAGMAKMNIFKFTIYSLLGILPWNFLLMWLGYYFGNNYDTVVEPIYKKFENVIILALILIIAILILRAVMKRRKNKK